MGLKRVLVTGGCGYVGAWLVPHLLAEGYIVAVHDPEHFGNGALPDNDNLLRRIEGLYDAMIILGGITQNEACEADPELARIENVEKLKHLPQADRVIYASSLAAYGSTEQPAVETDPLRPTTLYGKMKAAAEQVIQKLYPHATIVRSASVCGYSPNMRFDTPVNAMALSALRHGVINVAGGDQLRTHIHIKDLTDFYKLLLTSDVEGQTFNVLGSSERIIDTAATVSAICNNAIINIGPRTDDRSYAASMQKAATFTFTPDWRGFKPKYGVADAVRDIQARIGNHWPDAETNPKYRRLFA